MLLYVVHVMGMVWNWIEIFAIVLCYIIIDAFVSLFGMI